MRCSQYDLIAGYACHMRHALRRASLISFTGRPIELVDGNTPAAFGGHDVAALVSAEWAPA